MNIKKSMIPFIIFVFLILLTVTAFADLSQPTASRFDSSDRYNVAASVSKAAYPNGTSNVIIVNGSDIKLSDALTATPLAKALNAPILLVNLDTIPDATRSEIIRLKPTNIYIIGGIGSVSRNIENNLSKSYHVTRIAGTNRYEVAKNVANKLKGMVSSFSKVYVVNGYKYADALAVAPIAAKEGNPILFVSVNVDSDTNNTANYIKSLGITKIDAIGGWASISDKVIKVLNAKRIDGKNRAALSTSIASNYYQNPNGIFIVNGYRPADTLSLGPYAVKYNYPILFVDNDGVSVNSAVYSYIKANGAYVESVVVAGGIVSVTKDALDAIVKSCTEANKLRPVATKLQINTTNVVLNVGESKAVTAAVYDQYGNVMNGANITWSSGDSTIATIDNNGVVTGVKEGTTTIKASCGNISASISVTVNNPYPEGFSRNLTVGNTGNDVKLLQSMLNEIGYTVGNVDGIYNNNTLNSVEDFQKNFSLPVSGIADLNTIKKLIDVDNQVKAVQGFYISGKGGYGHGVGMTQFGAEGMAEAGYNYKQIIQYYYTGVNIGNYNTDNVNVRIALSLNKSSVSFTSGDDYTVVDRNTNKPIYTYPANSVTTVAFANGNYVLTNSRVSAQIQCSDPIKVMSNSAGLWHKGYLYAGEFDITRNGNNVDLINNLNIETYLQGVIPAEVPSIWKDDALKAQTLAARTYTLRNLKPSKEFDLYDDERSQAYRGLSVDNPNVDKLIQDTKGEVITYNGQLADAVYSASAGGYTVDASFEWGNYVPYLLGKPDPFDHSKYAKDWWNTMISRQDISSAYPTVGQALNVKVLKTEFERPTLLEIIGTKGTVDVTGTDFMSKVGNAFKSDLYTISIVK